MTPSSGDPTVADTLLGSLRSKMVLRYLDFELPPVIGPLLELVEKAYSLPAKKIPIYQPIFIVGCHRSGTSVFYNAMAEHPDLACITNCVNMTPTIPLIHTKLKELVAPLLVFKDRWIEDGVAQTPFTPSEGIRIFERYVPDLNQLYMDETIDNPRLETYLKATIQKLIWQQKAKRFLNKNPDNSVRIRYLDKLFPDSYFVHIVRDGRAVAASMIKFREKATDFFGPNHRHSSSLVRVKRWQEINKVWDQTPLKGSGLLWREVMETIEEDRRHLQNQEKRYLEIRYEDFLTDPVGYLEQIYRFCNLPWNPTIEAQCRKSTGYLEMGRRNDAWKKNYSPQEVDDLLATISPTLNHYGYHA